MFRLFLSHRFQDAGIASVIREELLNWNIPEKSIFQAGEPGKGLRPGDTISDALVAEIKQTDFFILVFTHLDEDWSYCMWELGIASGADTKPTNVIVLQCGPHIPRVRRDHLAVDARNPKAIRDLVLRFHKEPEFLIPHNDTRNDCGPALEFLQNTAERVIDQRAKSLFEKLAVVVPDGKHSEHHRFEYLEIHVDPATAREVRRLREDARESREDGDTKTKIERRAKANQIVLERARATENSGADGLSRFGLKRSDVTIQRLFKSWESDMSDERDIAEPPQEELRWQDDFLYDVARAVDGKNSRPSVNFFRAINSDEDARFQVLVTRTREVPDGSVYLDVYVFKTVVEPSSGSAQISAIDLKSSDQ